jgi:predicted RNase H-like HicB family nuclease
MHDTQFTYSTEWSEVDQEHVGMCAEFPSLSWLAATRDEALSGIQRVVKTVVRDLQRNGESVPSMQARLR